MKIEITENKKWQHSLTIKMVVLGMLGIFLLVPLELIKSIIKERQTTSENVKKEISFQWAGKQTITGPVLNIPVWINPSGSEVKPYRKIFHLMPEELIIEGDISTEIRHRSIYKAVVYNTDLKLSGNFLIPEINSEERGEIMWKESYYTLGISDNRGLKGGVTLRSDSVNLEAIPGLKDSDLFSKGVSFETKLPEKGKKIKFSINLGLSGSESINFTPIGKTTEVNLKSDWTSPGFQGNFLPLERVINESGFNAKWLVTNLNRNFPQIWAGSSFIPADDSFGIDFVLPVDHYQKSLRSAKYGILFIALTFMALLFAEFTIADKLHLFHYLLVALALVLFFSLLNALSEHTGFNLAYFISSGSTIILITLFLNSLIKKIRPILFISGLLIFLYAFIFILLTLNDYAYLAGNIGLFGLLAVTMRLSSKLGLLNKENG